MKIVIAGGSGYLGRCVASFYKTRGADVIVLSRTRHSIGTGIETVVWDGKTAGNWATNLEGTDLLINLTGRSVDCRYTEKNKREILESRLNSIRVLGEVVVKLKQPPLCWIQMSSATIYRHAEDMPQDEISGETGTGFSVDVCREWEASFETLDLPATRKIIIRTGIVLGQKGGAFPVLAKLAKIGLGGAMGRGTQYISWIHEEDFVAIVEWLRNNEDSIGIYNCTAPWPLPNSLFMQNVSSLVRAWIRIATPAWLLRIGAFIIRTETELILKSRWVKPRRLMAEGYTFNYPRAAAALEQLLVKDK